MAPAVYKRDNCRTPGCSSANKTNSYPGPGVVKGRRRRFRLVSEQKKTVEREFRFWPRLDYQPLFGKMSPRSSPRRMKERWWKTGPGRRRKSAEIEPKFLTITQPFPAAVLLAPFFARPLTLVHHSLLLNRTETLVTQAIGYQAFFSLTDGVIFIDEQSCVFFLPTEPSRFSQHVFSTSRSWVPVFQSVCRASTPTKYKLTPS